jgi:recombinational DNA repair protein RecT
MDKLFEDNTQRRQEYDEMKQKTALAKQLWQNSLESVERHQNRLDATKTVLTSEKAEDSSLLMQTMESFQSHRNQHTLQSSRPAVVATQPKPPKKRKYKSELSKLGMWFFDNGKKEK